MAVDGPRTLVQHLSATGPTVVQVRGSLLVSSLQTLRELGLYPRYIGHLPESLHEHVLFALASSWISCELALAHYGACDAMQLGEDELQAVGEHVAKRILGSFLATLLRGSRALGAHVRPVAALQTYPRLWDRLLDGGACTVTQTGPKDAIIESRGVPMFRYSYFRAGYVSLIRGAGLMFGDTLYVKALRSTDSSMKIGLSWV